MPPPLVQQHIESVESRTSASLARRSSFVSFRIVDHIGNDRVFMEKDGSLMMEASVFGAMPTSSVGQDILSAISSKDGIIFKSNSLYLQFVRSFNV